MPFSCPRKVTSFFHKEDSSSLNMAYFCDKWELVWLYREIKSLPETTSQKKLQSIMVLHVGHCKFSCIPVQSEFRWSEHQSQDRNIRQGTPNWTLHKTDHSLGIYQMIQPCKETCIYYCKHYKNAGQTGVIQEGEGWLLFLFGTDPWWCWILSSDSLSFPLKIFICLYVVFSLPLKLLRILISVILYL